MARTFQNPANGHTESISDIAAGMVVLFGPIYLAVCGLWLHFFIWMILVGGMALATGGPGLLVALPIAVIAYGFSIERILANKYLRKGWQEVDAKPDQITGQEVITVSGQRECPYCAELIKSQAIKCKHCGSEVQPIEQVELDMGTGQQWFVTLPFSSMKEYRQVAGRAEELGYKVPSETSKFIRVGPYRTEEQASTALRVMTDDHKFLGGSLEVAEARAK